MKKTELINEIYRKSNFPKNEVKLIIDNFETCLEDNLPNEDKVKLSIGYFYKTASQHPRFSPSPKFTEKIRDSAQTSTAATETTPQPVAPAVKSITGKKNALRNHK